MFSFLKPKASAIDIANGVYEAIRGQAEGDQWAHIRPDVSSLKDEIVIDECIYFTVFSFDLATFAALGNTPARQVVLNPFIRNITTWLKNRPAPPIQEVRLCFTPDTIDDPKFFPLEEAEPASVRLNRRMAIYTEAASTHHELGQNYMVALTFSALCGVNNASYVVAISSYFSQLKVGYFKLLKSYRIPLEPQ